MSCLVLNNLSAKPEVMIARTFLLLLLAVGIFPLSAVSQNIQISDPEMQFAISVLQHYKQNQFRDGSNVIANSFTLFQSPVTNAFEDSQTQSVNFNRVKLLNADLENYVDQDFRILQPTSDFNRNTSQINLSFSYSGRSFATPFILKWFSRTYSLTVEECFKYTQREQRIRLCFYDQTEQCLATGDLLCRDLARWQKLGSHNLNSNNNIAKLNINILI